MVKKKKSKDITIPVRVVYFIIGLTVTSIIIIYSFRWEDLPIIFTLGGLDATKYFLAPMLVLIGILASSFTSSAFSGKNEVDT